MKKEDRKELLKKFTEVVYARTRSDFLTRQEELDNCETFEKYPQYQNYLVKSLVEERNLGLFSAGSKKNFQLSVQIQLLMLK